MLPLNIKHLSSKNLALLVVLLFGISAIFTSVFAITSGQWIHVFRHRPEVAGKTLKSERHHGNLSTELDRDSSCCQYELMTYDVTNDDVSSTVPHGKGADHVVEPVEEAFGGLWSVCIHYRCSNDDDGSTSCLLCSIASDPALKRFLRSHVSNAALTITADASRTLVTFVLSAAILVCGVSVEILGLFQRSFFLIIAAFCFTVAGLLQLLGLFLYAMTVNEEMRSLSSGETTQFLIGYNYGMGSISAVLAFFATNASAISAAYSYRGRRIGKCPPPPTTDDSALGLVE